MMIFSGQLLWMVHTLNGVCVCVCELMESSQLSHSTKTLNPVLAGNPLMQRMERLPETDLFKSKGETIKDKERKTGLLESICESATDSVIVQHNR